MGKKIIDQYTDRTDLSYHQKWVLRNPDRYKSCYLTYNSENADRLMELDRKRRNRIKVEDTKVKLSSKSITAKSESRIGKAIRKEILHLASRGKDIAYIVVWTKVPASTVISILNQPNPP